MPSGYLHGGNINILFESHLQPIWRIAGATLCCEGEASLGGKRAITNDAFVFFITPFDNLPRCSSFRYISCMRTGRQMAILTSNFNIRAGTLLSTSILRRHRADTTCLQLFDCAWRDEISCAAQQHITQPLQ
jgi:hypothetical protein